MPSCAARRVSGCSSTTAASPRADALAVAITDALGAIERDLDEGTFAARLTPGDLETVNAALVRAKDAVWAVARDRIPTARAVADLGGTDLGWSAIEAYTSIQEALSALDRLEVRGRDSAGLTVLVRDHGLDLDEAGVAALLAPRIADRLFRSRAARTPEGHVAVVYKAAAEIGELGDNTRALRDAIRDDELLPPRTRRRPRFSARPRTHPLGQRRHRERAQRAPARQRRGR